MPDPEPVALPADSDVDLQVPRQRAELRRAPWSVLGVIAVGGALGSSARYGLGVTFPVGPRGFPWSTFLVNVSGGLLIGVLMVCVTQRTARDAHRERPMRALARPFLGVGVLGGFTTFSTYVVEIQRLLGGGAVGTALLYLVTTLVAALAATGLGLVLTRWLRRRLRLAAATS